MPVKKAGARRRDHHVKADPFLPVGAVVEHAHAQAHNEQNQRDFNRNRKNADHGAQWPVHQVGENHLIHSLRITNRQPE